MKLFIVLSATLLSTAALNPLFAAPSASPNQAKAPVVLLIKKKTLDVNGKTADVFRIEQPDGTWGYRGIKGQMFEAVVKNQTDKPTVLHWHGLVVPNNQDGVPYVTQKPILPGGEYHYRFKLKQSGTYWMHSHHDLQVQQFLSAPLIIEDPAETVNSKEVIFFIGDFSYKKPEVIFAELKKGQMTHMHHQGAMAMPMKPSAPDLVDVAYDAFLTNYRTLKNPEVVRVKPGENIRLRFIAGSAMTNFFLNTGQLKGKAIALDGELIKPVNANQFQLAVGQRLDVMVTIPAGENAYPILAQGEGTTLQTGLILATPKASIPLLKEQASRQAGALNYDQEFQFKALKPLAQKTPGQRLTVNLEGDMMRYVWTINNQKWPEIKPLKVDENKRVEMIFNNKTMMAHPMHLHGHVFEVTEIDGKKINEGLLHDTVLVLPNSSVKVVFDTDNPGNWMMHCHMLYHQENGMMTIVSYAGVKAPILTMQH
ncbi:Copper resistance protein A [Legionella busanensis]|uniref:Copper resistance protein A n=1 Tax=Legionella busanensis TaxID=190655 RepID=A0A378JGN4_9GAMM|nr:multicopper oxidase family protein [Legionella busanensis]STX50157.1 Copper resistance protein A [Legionella busanensis]